MKAEDRLIRPCILPKLTSQLGKKSHDPDFAHLPLGHPQTSEREAVIAMKRYRMGRRPTPSPPILRRPLAPHFPENRENNREMKRSGNSGAGLSLFP
jgi:hypothetical protein